MISKNKPEPKTLSPKSLSELLFTNDDKSIYIIEDIIQRDFVWNYDCCETLWYDMYRCIHENMQNMGNSINSYAGKNYNKSYLNIGNIEYSEVDPCNHRFLTKLEYGEYKSVVDGSQRLRLCTFGAFAFMYIINRENGDEYIDVNTFKNNDGLYKLNEVGIEKMKQFYSFLENTCISKIEKSINSFESVCSKFATYNAEREYFDIFSLFVRFIERDILGKYDINEVFKIVLNNVSLYEEKIPYENKFERFVDRNKKGTPMSDADIYPKFIINQFKDDEKLSIYNTFKNYKSDVEKIVDKGLMRSTKKNVVPLLYIMIEALKISLCREYETHKEIPINRAFRSSFTLGDIICGIEKCFRNGYVFKSCEDTISYFNLCRDIARFMINDSYTRHDNLYDDCYYLRDFGQQDLLWWYCIKPCYLTSIISDIETRRLMKKALYIVYSFYSVRIVNTTNVQNTIDMYEAISKDMILHRDNPYKLISEVKARIKDYIDSSQGYEGIINNIASLDYTNNKGCRAMKNIFAAIEYRLCEKYSIDTTSVYRLWIRKKAKTPQFTLDHWLPEAVFKDYKDKVEYHRIGNIVPLEPSLNSSKQAKTDVNAHIYTQSNFIQTQLMPLNNRSVFDNKTLEDIKKANIIPRISEEVVNAPTLADIQNRTKIYSDSFVSFIREFLEE